MFRHLVLTAVLLGVLISSGFGGIWGPGEYSGVVVFDRWDGCTLYNGVYVMYISDDIKEQLRPYAARVINLNVTDVFQPMNPGDGLIKAFDSIELQSGSGQQPYGVTLEGIELKNLIACKQGQKPAVLMHITNRGSNPVEIHSQELAPTLLIKQTDVTRGSFTPADGPSVALITRQAFWIGSNPGGESRWQGGGVSHATEYHWTIGDGNALPHIFTLQTGERRRIKITFDLPPGEYEFLSGYGGGVHAGKCITGNRIAFDLDEKGLMKWAIPTYYPEDWDTELINHVENMREPDKELVKRFDLSAEALSETSTDQLFLHVIQSPMKALLMLYNKTEIGLQRLLNASSTVGEFYKRDDIAEGVLKMYREYNFLPEIISDESMKNQYAGIETLAENPEYTKLFTRDNMNNRKIVHLCMPIMDADQMMLCPQLFPETQGYEKEFLQVLVERYEKINELKKIYDNEEDPFGSALACIRPFCIRLSENIDDEFSHTLKNIGYGSEDERRFIKAVKEYLEKE